MTKQDFAQIFFWGTLVYGVSFVLNGPLTDRLGGRVTILISAIGSAACNLMMGLVLAVDPPAAPTPAELEAGYTSPLTSTYSLLYAANMYFQSFGAVSIVKVNAHWFHVRERGVFGGIFGILISLGIYFAFDWGAQIVELAGKSRVYWVFFVPAAILAVFAALDALLVFDEPSRTGHPDFDTGDATFGDGGRLGVMAVAAMMFRSPVIVTIALIEFCSGYLRQAIMQWYTIFAKQTGIGQHFVPANWGMLLCVAGICGGMFAGTLSDHLFGSRRGPVAALLYAAMLAGSVAMYFLLESFVLGWVMVAMSLCIIGVHGMLSGTASMDFGGKRNAGVAVGIIDGFVYLGTAAQALILGFVLPKDGTGGAKEPGNWTGWPLVMIPAAVLGLAFAMRLWHARPRGGAVH
jgi:OPA family glycerol-3-phosphate transporter-like MFS transporter